MQDLKFFVPTLLSPHSTRFCSSEKDSLRRFLRDRSAFCFRSCKQSQQCVTTTVFFKLIAKDLTEGKLMEDVKRCFRQLQVSEGYAKCLKLQVFLCMSV